MAIDPKIPNNLSTNVRSQLGVNAATQVVYVALRPLEHTAIHLPASTDNITVAVTTTASKADGTKLTDMEDSDVLWQNVLSNSADGYFKGDSSLLTGVKLSAAAITVAAPYSITQTNK